jgi:hypothetical protein
MIIKIRLHKSASALQALVDDPYDNWLVVPPQLFADTKHAAGSIYAANGAEVGVWSATTAFEPLDIPDPSRGISPETMDVLIAEVPE